MTELKCPFCQQELDIDPCGEMGCLNDKCKESVFLIGTKELWQELITTKKALDVAVDALDRMAVNDSIYDIIARNAMKRIKELEQKDK